MAAVPVPQDLPRTLGELRRSRFSEERLAHRTRKRRDPRESDLPFAAERTAFSRAWSGIEETVAPQVVNAILSRHNFILLGLRGQAKTKLIRLLTTLLDEYLPFIEGSEIRDNPYQPISKSAARGSPRWATKRRSTI